MTMADSMLCFVVCLTHVAHIQVPLFSWCSSIPVLPGRVLGLFLLLLGSGLSYNSNMFITIMYSVPNMIFEIRKQYFNFCFNLDILWNNYQHTAVTANCFTNCKLQCILVCFFSQHFQYQLHQQYCWCPTVIELVCLRRIAAIIAYLEPLEWAECNLVVVAEATSCGHQIWQGSQDWSSACWWCWSSHVQESKYMLFIFTSSPHPQ